MTVTGKTNKTKANNVVSSDFDLWVLLDQTRFAISRSRELELAHFGLTQMHAHVLFALLSSGGAATLYEIAKFTMRQHHSVSTLVKRMEQQGLVKRTKNPTDNKIQIVITPKGRQLYEKATQSSIEMIFSSLSGKEKQELTHSLKQLRGKARNLLGIDYKPPFLP